MQSFPLLGPNPACQQPAREVSLSCESRCLGLSQCGQEAEDQPVVHICQLDLTSQPAGFISTCRGSIWGACVWVCIRVSGVPEM